MKKSSYFSFLCFLAIFTLIFIYLFFGKILLQQVPFNMPLDNSLLGDLPTKQEKPVKTFDLETELFAGLYIQEYKIKKEGQNDSLITVLRIDPKNFSFALAQDINNPLPVSQWQEKLQAVAVINGSFFTENYLPSGGLIINGEKFGTLTANGQNGYTGMLSIIQNYPDLTYLPEQPVSSFENFDFVLQSFPTLILPGGRQGVLNDSGKKAARTILANTKNNDILFIISHQASFSLFEIMQELQRLNLDIDMALNLDGGPSSGISLETGNVNYTLDSSPIPNVIFIKTKE